MDSLREKPSSDEPPRSAAAPHAAIVPISTVNAEHYNWGERCQAWFLLKSPSLTVIEEEMPPGTSESLHFHSWAQQLFYILDGEARMEIGGESVDLKPSQSIPVPPGSPHRILNVSTKALKFLVISAPDSHGDKVPLTGNTGSGNSCKDATAQREDET
jgi:mannose-6-phosphate isomerase-like protein (cupin superfamily)